MMTEARNEPYITREAMITFIKASRIGATMLRAERPDIANTLTDYTTRLISQHGIDEDELFETVEQRDGQAVRVKDELHGGKAIMLPYLPETVFAPGLLDGR